MQDYRIITADELDKLFEAEEESGRTFLEWQGEKEIDGLLYTLYYNKKNRETIARRKIRNVNMGFNSNEPGKLEEFIEIVEREGACTATWGVTGRTMHEILAHQLAKQLPQYTWTIRYNYFCQAEKK